MKNRPPAFTTSNVLPLSLTSPPSPAAMTASARTVKNPLPNWASQKGLCKPSMQARARLSPLPSAACLLSRRSVLGTRRFPRRSRPLPPPLHPLDPTLLTRLPFCPASYFFSPPSPLPRLPQRQPKPLRSHDIIRCCTLHAHSMCTVCVFTSAPV